MTILNKGISYCENSEKNQGFKTIIRDNSGNKKLDDGFDSTRDLVEYSAKYDENKNIFLKIKTAQYKQEAFENNSSIVILLDFLKDNGTYLLPFNIRGATDHWWEIAYMLKNHNIKTEVTQELPELEKYKNDILQLVEINPEKAEITLKINTEKLKEMGWSNRFPLYTQIITKKDYIITDSFNDPKPYQNANFLVGAMPINKFLDYNSKCIIINQW